MAGLIFILLPCLVHAYCEIVGTIDGGHIVRCTGTDTDGFCIGGDDGNDIIIVENGAVVSNAVQQWLEAIASADAIAIDAGGGDNRIINYGSITATADANALPVDGSASQATANATGISAGDGADDIQNPSTIASTATSNSESGDISLTLEGNTQSQSATTSTATTIGIDGGAGNNEITNAGAITAMATSEAEAPFIDLNLTDTAYADVSVKAHATGTGISADGSVVNEQTGAITVTVSSQANAGNVNANIWDSSKADLNTIAQTTATGITGSVGNDTITSTGTITVNATSNAEGSVDLESRTDAEINATIESKAAAVGIDSGEGDDTMINHSTLSTTSTASAGSDNVNTSIWAPGVTDTTTKSIAVSTGILSGLGKDAITNEGSMTVYSEATTEVSNVLLSGGIEVALSTDVKGGATSEATALGIDGDADDDQITNKATIHASSSATTSSHDVLLSLVGIGTFATPTTATAGSVGIDGGDGKDELTNSGTVTVNATSSADALNISVSGFQLDVVSDGDASTKAVAHVTGISGGGGDDKVTNTGTVTATADSTASIVDISVEFLGSSHSEASTIAEALATGIHGEAGTDEIKNNGTITVSAESEVDALGVDVKFKSIPTKVLEWFGVNLVDATTAARAIATGIDGGENGDTITNESSIDVTADAEADSDKISVKLPLPTASGSQSGAAPASGGPVLASGTIGTGRATASGLTGSEVQSATLENAEVVGDDEFFDTGTTAQATATGIAGGGGGDTITNKSGLKATGISNAESLSVQASVNLGKGGLSIFKIVPNVAVVDATTTAEAEVTGIDGGPGNDTITNEADVEANADQVESTSTLVDMALSGATEKGLAWGGALSDATTKAVSTVRGIAGSEGDDTITNSGKIKAVTSPDADSVSVSAALMGAKEGLVAGFTYVDASTTAEGTATGIAGGADNDTITNTSTGEIEVTSEPTSTSAQVGMTLEGAFSQEWSAVLGGAMTDGTTKAISNAAGIEGGEGADTITSSGKITANALPDADSASVSATLAGAQDGLTLGFTYADNTTTAEANAVGIDGGSGNDIITNTSTGQIEVTADPTSSSASVSATITGVTKGTGIVGGAALTNGTTKAISNVAGIKGGEGDDTITNSGKIIVKSNPDADSASVSVNLGAALGELGLVGGFSYSDATTTAQATAIGIDGGAGDDTITNTEEIEVTTESTASSASIGVTAQGVKGMGAAVGISLTDGTTKAISTATGIAGGEGNDTITNSGKITVKALPDADSASVSVSLSAAKEGVAAGGTFADATTIAQATATGIDGGEGNDTITNSGTIEVTADSESSSASVSVSAEGTMTGAALGVALSDGTTKAISNAAGIKGGGGNDTITNSLVTTVTSTADIDSASVTVNLGGAQTGLVAGVAAADVTTTAESVGTGIGGGSGDDTIENFGLTMVTTKSTISAASVSVNAGVAVEGVALGAALADGKTVATSSAVGLEGGEGSDTLTNRGFNWVSATSDVTAASVAVNLEGTKAGLAGGVSLVDGENNASALAIGISGGSGNDTIGNDTGGFWPFTWVEATTTSRRTNVSVTGNFSLYGAALGASFADATNIATADARGIEGGEGDDKITNTSFLNSVATTTADTTSVSFSANVAIFGAGVGASLASAETTGNALATGISGGEGDDEIKNMSSGVITATSTATAKAKAISVDISYASFSTADATTTASAGSSGITGGSGQDFILNEGTIDLGAISTGDGVAGTGTLTGYGAAKVDVNSWAMTTGIDGGTEDDTIINRNEISTLSNATAKGRSVSVNLLGAVFAEAGTNAHAITNGLSGDAGGDQVTNESSIDLTATSNADLTAVSVTLLGYSNSDGSSLSEAIAIGIDGGDGENTLTNTSAGSIKATTTAYADTASVSVNLAGAVKADAGSTGSATAIGIAAGKENDSIRNEGTVNLSSTSDTEASATEVTLIGYGDSNAKAVSAATVKGIDGGDGINTITNSSSGTITGTATALADASSYDIQLSGGGKAKAGTEATASAIGIAGGNDKDTIQNEGTINLAAQSTLVSESRSYKFFGVGIADADSIAQTFATGIDGGGGENTLINTTTGSINVSSNASATVTSMSANIGIAGASASTTSKALSMGLKSGDGRDTILNEGSMNITATSSTGAAGGNFSVIGLSFGDSLTEAITDGINAGGGNDEVINTGSIIVGSVQDNDHPMAYAEVASVSFSFFNISSAIFGSKAQATGIIGGGGDDTILNTGTIIVGDDDWMAKGRGYGFSGNFFEFLSLTSVGTTAETIVTGVEGGDGNDTLLNDTSGVLTVKATSYADAEGAGDTTFGNLAAFASSTTKATATGMSGGGGDDGIENKGMISVGAKTWANAYSDAEAGWGGPTSDAAANATATASGIDAGKGQNLVRNEGQIAVNSAASATPIARSDADIGRTEAETTAYAKALAFGILAGDDGNTVVNATTGTINVTATARTDDGLGNIAKAFQDVDAKATAHMWDNTAKKWLPVTANAAGISLGDGADLVKNDGVITVTASSFPSVNAYTSSNVYTARSDAETYASAIVKGIAAGMGANEVINNGQINVNAWSHGNPITDSWSRDQTATANAVAESSATATGIEGDGNIANASLGNIDVKARATTNAYANTSAETTTPTATLVATATGIGTASSADSTVRDRLWNDGNITVTAVAGEDENGNNKEIAYADTDTWVRSCRATATGTSTVDAAGIRVGERGAEITNNGNMEVLGRARAYVRAYADSRDYHPRGNAYSTAIAKASGISAAGGDNLINNYGTMKVEARVQDAYTRGDTWSSWSTCRSLAETNATATATGIQTGAGIDEINSYGQLTVVADADAESYAWADTRDNNLADEYETTTAKAQADAVGIDAGVGNNSVNHSGSMSVSAVSNARAGAGGGHASVTRTEQAVSSAVGILTGSGDDSIVFTSDSNLVTTAEGTANDANVRATGIDAGDGINILQSQSSVSVVANAISEISAEAEIWGIKTGSSGDRIALGTGSLINTAANATSSSDNGVTNASAIGIDAGEGTNQITNYGVVNSNADATAEVKREEIFMWSITYPATAVSNVTGIKSGQGADIINNYGQISVNSEAMAVINQVLDLSAGTKSATANAIGIDAGDGDNFVANYGTVDVGAIAAAGTGANPNARTDGVENTTAIGILTGDGDDTIINSGAINAANQRLEWVGGWIHITSQPGIGISSGGGSDQLFLMDGSETNGHIDLGDGDDWLTFVGNPLVTGNVTGAAGTDSLVFEGAGSIGFTPVTFENAIKQGAGTYTVPSLPTMQRIEVNQGTLQINSDYAMANDSTFQTNVNGDGSHGQLKVNGTAKLAGALKVIKGPGAYVNGTKYDVLVADTTTDWFSDEIMPATVLVSFRANGYDDRVEVESLVKSFTTVANNRVHKTIGQYMDRILPTASGDLSYVLGEFQNLSGPQFSTAFSSLSPDSYDNFTKATFGSTWQYIKSLQQRMNTVRSYSSTAGNDLQTKPVLLAYSGSDASLGQFFTPGQLSPVQGKNGLWFNAFGQWGDQDEDDGFTGFDYDLWGTTLGFDYTFSDKLMAGLSLGYSGTDIDLDGHLGNGDIGSLFGSLYGSYFNKNAYIEAAFSYGRNWYENSRLVMIGPIQRRASSEHDADAFSGYLGAGYYFNLKDWALLGPFGSLRYVYLDEESFRETGADSVSLWVDSRKTDSLVSELGLQVTRAFGTKYGSLIPELSAAWSYDFDIDDRVITTSFAGSPGAEFSMEGRDVEKHGAILGAGLTFIHQSGFSTSLRYSGEFRSGYKSHGIIGELRYTF